MVDYLVQFLSILKTRGCDKPHTSGCGTHCFFDFNNENARKVLGWQPKLSNKEALKIAYDSYLQFKKSKRSHYGTSHRKPLKQGALKLLKLFS